MTSHKEKILLTEEACQRWMKEEWPKILSQARQMGAPLFFGDEAGFALWGSLSYTWAPRGQQPQVKRPDYAKDTKSLAPLSSLAEECSIKALKNVSTAIVIKPFLIICSHNSLGQSSLFRTVPSITPARLPESTWSSTKTGSSFTNCHPTHPITTRSNTCGRR